MTTQFPEIKDATLQLLADRVLTSIRQGNGNAYANFFDRLGNPVPANSLLSGGVANTASQAGPSRGTVITITINPDGVSAYATVEPLNAAGIQAAQGVFDQSLLAPHIS